ncbi:MAG TPA: DUF1294 domain-containing protein [Firmicutes bacterium]|nr:DUF1294 domain-containing protein [Bacillota bacterium]
MKFVLLYFLIANCISYALMGIDKTKAKRHMHRISEKTLLIFAFFGGALGVLLGMYGFRHKTLHKKFTVCVPLFLLFHVALFIAAYRGGIL